MMGPEQFWWGGMWLFPIIFLAILLGLVYLVVVRTSPPGRSSAELPERSARPESAMEILAKRYARGELEREEFLEMRKDLQ